MTDLSTLHNHTNSVAYGINDSGQVVGSSGNSRGTSTAFLYSDGKMIDLNNLLPANSGWFLAEARKINNRGQIVGIGVINGENRAFLMAPIAPTSTP
jgi:probable HAF family extracellular repeat protein